MKKNKLSFLKTLFIGLLFSSCHQPKNIDGIWSDENGSTIKEAYASFYQKGDSVFMHHFLIFKDTPFFEFGKGIRKKDSLIYTVSVRYDGPKWGNKTGVHRLKIKENKLEGIYITNGKKGALVFTKKGY